MADEDRLWGESLLPLRQASAVLPTHPSQSRLYAWARYGVLARDGERVYLETLKVGGVLYTSEEAFRRFVERVTDDEIREEAG